MWRREDTCESETILTNRTSNASFGKETGLLLKKSTLLCILNLHIFQQNFRFFSFAVLSFYYCVVACGCGRTVSALTPKDIALLSIFCISFFSISKLCWFSQGLPNGHPLKWIALGISHRGGRVKQSNTICVGHQAFEYQWSKTYCNLQSIYSRADCHHALICEITYGWIKLLQPLHP